ncbi:hypothetical protein ACOCJ5_10315 [Knoellia sp. CPCC 206450]|uniref:phage major capsid protein n=1 Tax=Knoellia tibetensis TaxID=3404798 RepID=UPI003B42BF3D
MTRLTIAGRLTAAEDRTLKGLLVPFGRPGYTNKGRVVVQPGGITYPADGTLLAALHATLDHLDERDNVARFVKVTETPAGLEGEWEALPTHGGDRLLSEFRSGKRTGISVELEPVTVADGIATGTLVGCAFPEKPAFADARLVAELAPDESPEDEDEDEDDTDDTDDLDDEADDTDPPAEDQPDADTERGTTVTRSATAPADLLASHAGGGTGTRRRSSGDRLLASDSSPQDVYRLLAQAFSSRNASTRDRLLAALSDIIPDNITDREQPAWIGELWSGNAYQRRIVPLLSSADLTGLKVKGWRWVTKPEMAAYAGNKAAIHSNAVDTEPYEEEAQRWAGGHDIDRKYKDFNDTEFFAAYFRAMSESYAKLTDGYALRRLKEGSQLIAAGPTPDGVPAGWAAVVDGALAVIDVGTPTFALVEKTLWRDMILTGTDKFLEFLNASIGFEEGTLNSSNFKLIPVGSSGVGTASSPVGLDLGEVIVGTKAAVTHRELGGGTPIRVDAVDIANGGVDEACFGYSHVDINDARGLVRVDLTADA